jgi:asparagine synthase (glutamine-hydrolysing)
LVRDTLEEAFASLHHRGPDHTTRWSRHNLFLGFHRLAIMDLSDRGQQPFVDDQRQDALLCNGEIYNSAQLRQLVGSSHQFQSDSDCEVLLPLIQQYGLAEASRRLDAEFALLYYDGRRGKLLASRDPMGIRPLFYGYTAEEGEILFASEAKALTPLCREVRPFPPGHYYDGEGEFHEYRSLTAPVDVYYRAVPAVQWRIRERLEQAVAKRLTSDAPLGFLLSGGLDSSLVCAIGQRLLDQPIRTFAIGTTTDAIDVKYAERVARYIGAQHTTVSFTVAEALDALREVIYHLETWDITTIRASVGMYLVCRYIRQHTDIKVLLTGEVSDELFGYKYTDFAPSAEAFQEEAAKRIREIHLYDVLRADRCISAHSLEARVPFGDLDFVDAVMATDPALKLNSTGMGKYHLRQALAQGDYLPDDILYREKAAFSDAVGHSMADAIKAHAAQTFTDADLKEAQLRYPHGTPFTKESLLYRTIFEEYFRGRAELVPAYWMPNRQWAHCDVDDPSARALPNYGKSGQ